MGGTFHAAGSVFSVPELTLDRAHAATSSRSREASALRLRAASTPQSRDDWPSAERVSVPRRAWHNDGGIEPGEGVRGAVDGAQHSAA
jgi:hypothetical protein